MRRHPFGTSLVMVVGAAAVAATLTAQQQTVGLSLPLASPRAEVRQVVGLTEVGIVYHRPAVAERLIWGGLVPYDQVWRAGANENTLISFGADVVVEGQPLAAGTYGLHAVPGEAAWQIVFSSDTTAWGSFSYDDANDVLRVTVRPTEAPHQERLAFTFDDVTEESATLSLRWDKLRVPIRVEIDTEAVTLASIREQLKGLSQFFWMGWNQAADYCLQQEINYHEALEWADRSIQAEERFENLSTKAQLLVKTGDREQATQLMDRALEIGTASQLHQYGRQLIEQGDFHRAMEIFQRNAEQHPDAWFIGVGLARGHSALGEFQKAAESMRIAWQKAPEDQKDYIESLAERLQSRQDIN